MSGPADEAGASRAKVPWARGGRAELRLLAQVPALRRARRVFALLSVLQTLAVIGQAALLARVVSGVFLHHRSLAQVAGDIVWLALAMAVRASAAGALEHGAQRASALGRAQLRQKLLDGVVGLGPAWLAEADRGALVSAAGPGTEALDGYISRALPAMASAMVTPPLVLAAIGAADWQSLAVLSVTVPLVPLFMTLIGKTTKRRMDRQWATLAKLAGQFLDLLEGITTLKVYGRSKAQVAAVADGAERYRQRTLSTLRVAFLSGLALDLLASLSVAVVAVDIGLRLDHGAIGLLPALTVLLLAPEVFTSVRAVGAHHHATEEARAVLTTVAGVLGAAARAAGPSGTGAPVPALAPGSPVARARGVGLSYPGRRQPALEDVDLTVRASQLTVLTGPSGAGKTSLLGLLLGRLAPTVGTLGAGGDEAPVPTGPAADGWRQAVAWSPQRPRPTQPTVADEVRLGAPGASDTELAEILRWCSAPSARTALGEDGSALSAGQRRRVALARAVARARHVRAAGLVPLVLLDEPTEDLDGASQLTVRRVVAELSSWAAVVVATHDLSLAEQADQHVLVDNGHARVDLRRSCSVPALPAPTAGPGAGHLVLAGRSSLAGAVLGEGQPSTTVPVTASAGAPSAGPEVAASNPAVGERRPLWTLWAGDRRARHSVLLAVGLGALAGVTGLALTATSTWLICRAAQHPNVQALAVAVVGVRTFALAKSFFRYGERLAAHDGGLRLLARARARVFASLEPLAPAGLGHFRRGDLLRRFTTDVDGAQEALVRAVVPLTGAISTAAVAIVLAGLVSVPAATVLAAGALVGGIGVPLAARAWAGDAETAAALAGRRDSLVAGLVEGLDELDAYGAARARARAIADLDRQVIEAGARSRRSAVAGVLASGYVSAACVPAVLAEATRGAASGRVAGILVGVAVVAALVAFEALGPIPAAFAALGRCQAGWRRVEQVLSSPVPVPEPARPLGPPTLVAALGAVGLRLSPAPGAPAVLDGACAEVARGRRLAVVGPSGAGKSTLLAALMRLLPPSAGRAYLAGPGGEVGLTELRAADVPPLVAGSLQGDHVFATTLRDNLKVVAPRATDADLDAVAERVGLGEWARSLPLGWSTQAGPDGALLSGGQRQRLLVARALLAAPQVLVLDEPTAHLDPVTEATVMADVRRATVGRTLVASTHRADLLEGFDQVLAIEGATLVPFRPGRGTVEAPVPVPVGPGKVTVTAAF